MSTSQSETVQVKSMAVIAGADTTPLPRTCRPLKPSSRKGKPNKKPHSAAMRERYARANEAMADATMRPLVRQEIYEGRMRDFFAAQYPGFAEFYEVQHEDLGWRQGADPDERLPSVTRGCTELVEKAGPKSGGPLQHHEWNGFVK